MSEQSSFDTPPGSGPTELVDLYDRTAFNLLFGDGYRAWRITHLMDTDGSQISFGVRHITCSGYGHDLRCSRLQDSFEYILRYYLDDQFAIRKNWDRSNPAFDDMDIYIPLKRFEQQISPMLDEDGPGVMFCPPLSDKLPLMPPAPDAETLKEIKTALNEQIANAVLARDGEHGWHFDENQEGYYRDIPRSDLKHFKRLKVTASGHPAIQAEVLPGGSSLRIWMEKDFYEQQYLPRLREASPSELGLNVTPVDFVQRLRDKKNHPNSQGNDRER